MACDTIGTSSLSVLAALHLLQKGTCQSGQPSCFCNGDQPVLCTSSWWMSAGYSKFVQGWEGCGEGHVVGGWNGPGMGVGGGQMETGQGVASVVVAMASTKSKNPSWSWSIFTVPSGLALATELVQLVQYRTRSFITCSLGRLIVKVFRVEQLCVKMGKSSPYSFSLACIYLQGRDELVCAFMHSFIYFQAFVFLFLSQIGSWQYTFIKTTTQISESIQTVNITVPKIKKHPICPQNGSRN